MICYNLYMTGRFAGICAFVHLCKIAKVVKVAKVARRIEYKKQDRIQKTLTDDADVKQLFMFLNSRSEKAKTQRRPSTPGPTKETTGNSQILSDLNLLISLHGTVNLA